MYITFATIGNLLVVKLLWTYWGLSNPPWCIFILSFAILSFIHCTYNARLFGTLIITMMFTHRRLLQHNIVGTSGPLQWHHYGHDGVSNHQPCDCLFYRLFRRRSKKKKTSKPRVTGQCEGNSPVTGEFPAQRASGQENVSIWWRLHVYSCRVYLTSTIDSMLYWCIIESYP